MTPSALPKQPISNQQGNPQANRNADNLRKDALTEEKTQVL